MMDIEYINQQNRIMIQDVKIVNQNYCVNWLPTVYHQDVLVCMKSSWVPAGDFNNLLIQHSDESIYQEREIYWKKVTRQTSVQVPVTVIRAPIDVILLPIKRNKIYIPENQDAYKELQKTIKGNVKCTKRIIRSWRSVSEELIFQNMMLPVENDEVVAEYMIDSLKYPITNEMMGKKIEIHHPKNEDCRVYIAKELSDKYNLIISEE